MHSSTCALSPATSKSDFRLFGRPHHQLFGPEVALQKLDDTLELLSDAWGQIVGEQDVKELPNEPPYLPKLPIYGAVLEGGGPAGIAATPLGDRRVRVVQVAVVAAPCGGHGARATLPRRSGTGSLYDGPRLAVSFEVPQLHAVILGRGGVEL